MWILGHWSNICEQNILLNFDKAPHNRHNTYKHKHTHTQAVSYHSPPQGISIVFKLGGAAAVACIFLCQVDKVRGEDQAQKANV